MPILHKFIQYYDLFTYFFIYLSICFPIYLFMNLCKYLFTYPLICLFTYLSICGFFPFIFHFPVNCFLVRSFVLLFIRSLIHFFCMIVFHSIINTFDHYFDCCWKYPNFLFLLWFLFYIYFYFLTIISVNRLLPMRVSFISSYIFSVIFIATEVALSLSLFHNVFLTFVGGLVYCVEDKNVIMVIIYWIWRVKMKWT